MFPNWTHQKKVLFKAHSCWISARCLLQCYSNGKAAKSSRYMKTQLGVILLFMVWLCEGLGEHRTAGMMPLTLRWMRKFPYCSNLIDSPDYYTKIFSECPRLCTFWKPKKCNLGITAFSVFCFELWLLLHPTELPQWLQCIGNTQLGYQELHMKVNYLDHETTQ